MQSLYQLSYSPMLLLLSPAVSLGDIANCTRSAPPALIRYGALSTPLSAAPETPPEATALAPTTPTDPTPPAPPAKTPKAATLLG